MSLKIKSGDKVKIGSDNSTFGRVDMIKGLLFKKYWCFYWGEQNGRVTDPTYGTYARWCNRNELTKVSDLATTDSVDTTELSNPPIIPTTKRRSTMTKPLPIDPFHDRNTNGKCKDHPANNDLENLLHDIADGWGTEFYDLGWKRDPDEGKILDLIERCEADVKKSLVQLLLEARVDTLNQIRYSDVKLNHGTIELMGHMSQQLNKEKNRLKELNDG